MAVYLSKMANTIWLGLGTVVMLSFCTGRSGQTV